MAEVKVTDLPAITLDSFTNNDSFLIIDDGAVRRLTRAVFYEWLAGNVQGQRGEQGVAGRDGVRGTNGLNGTNGTNGISAYQVAVQNGFVGSAEAWLASMKGDAGAKGLDGGDGWSPVFKTEDYQGGSYLKIVDWVGGTGEKPVTLGYVSNEGIVSTVAVATNLKGDIGLTGAKGETGEKGEKGDKGDRGFDGATGTNAYYLAVESGFVGTQEQWLLSLNPSEVSKDPNNIISKKLDGMYASVDPVATATAIDAIVDRNFLTDSERAKLEALKTSKYLGTFLTPEEIPTVGATAGNYADVDSGLESVDTERWIYDVESLAFVKAVSIPASETNESVKTKYEANDDTNAFTDAEKLKLDTLQIPEPVILKPIIRIYNDKVEIADSGTSLTPLFIKNGVGDYTVEATSGIYLGNSSVILPRDINGNYSVAATIEDVLGTIKLKTFKRVFDAVEGTYSADLLEPIDIPLSTWVEVKLKYIEV